MTLQCTFSVPGCELCSLPHLPVHRGSDLLVCRQLQGVHHSQDLIKVSPSGGWVQDGEFQLLIRAKNKHLSTGRQSQGLGRRCLSNCSAGSAQPCCSSLSWGVACLIAGVWTGEMPWWGFPTATSDAEAQGTWCLLQELLFPMPACFAVSSL